MTVVNVFALDERPTVAAEFLIDRHVLTIPFHVSLILAAANGGPYNHLTKEHPWVQWVLSGRDNYKWLYLHGLAACKEYTYRYGKPHKSLDIITLLDRPCRNLKEGSTPFIENVPSMYKCKDPVKAYRNFYMNYILDAKWTKREKPYWWFS